MLISGAAEAEETAGFGLHEFSPPRQPVSHTVSRDADSVFVCGYAHAYARAHTHTHTHTHTPTHTQASCTTESQSWKSASCDPFHLLWLRNLHR